jgi:hypothetical protein
LNQASRPRKRLDKLAMHRVGVPPPKDRSEVFVFASLRLRWTIGEIDETPLSSQTPAKLLWAASGVPRESGANGLGRTAASGSSWQENDIYKTRLSTMCMLNVSTRAADYFEPGAQDPGIQESSARISAHFSLGPLGTQGAAPRT